MSNFSENFYSLYSAKKSMDEEDYEPIKRIILYLLHCEKTPYSVNATKAINKFNNKLNEVMQEFEDSYIKYKLNRNKRCKDCINECHNLSLQERKYNDCPVYLSYLNKASFKSTNVLFSIADDESILIPMFIRLGERVAENSNLILKFDTKIIDFISYKILKYYHVESINADTLNIIPNSKKGTFPAFKQIDRILIGDDIYIISKGCHEHEK